MQLAQEEFPQALFISASERLGLETLRHKLVQLVNYALVPRSSHPRSID